MAGRGGGGFWGGVGVSSFLLATPAGGCRSPPPPAARQGGGVRGSFAGRLSCETFLLRSHGGFRSLRPARRGEPFAGPQRDSHEGDQGGGPNDRATHRPT